jgi:hypothetical protein
MAEHKHGSLDVKEQEKTFAAFVTLTTRTVIGIIVFLILLAIVNG